MMDEHSPYLEKITVNLFFDTSAAKTGTYKNNSQKIRFLSERWLSHTVFCPHCGGSSLTPFENNRPVADFYCRGCDEEYELKSHRAAVYRKILDGGYQTMLDRLRSQTRPSFFFLHYDAKDFSVKNLMIIPKHFFIPEIIEKRKPLSKNAKRSGWVGCNILLGNIPNSGKIFYIQGGVAKKKRDVLKIWQKTLFLRNIKKAELKGWTSDVMLCIDKLQKSAFTLKDLYAFESFLSKKHPKNKHIKDKIRQQLQFLRNNGYLIFLGRGKYKITL